MPTKSLSLPTLSAFKKFSIRRRSLTFLKWLRTQRGWFEFNNNSTCPLARFGAALNRGKTVSYGVTRGFVADYETDKPKFCYHPYDNYPSYVGVLDEDMPSRDNPLIGTLTYNRAAKALAKLLNVE